MSKTIGVIGLGSIGMRHAKNLLAMGHHVLAIEPDEKKRRELVGGVTMPEINHMNEWALENREALIIASPTELHAEQMMIATQRGMHLFIEKPIASTKDGIDHTLHILESYHKKKVMVGNNLRFHSCVKKAKAWLSEGLIGKPLWASFCVAQHNTKYTDPVVLNWGAHEFDLALYLLGPATVTAAAGNDQIFDTCLLHEYGVPSTIHCDYVTRPERRAFVIAGEGWLMSANLVAGNIILFDTEGSMKGTSGIAQPNPGFDQTYKDEMQAFIDLIDGKPVPHAATGEDGLHALELILEAQRMAEK